jgi:hypothetical protein
MQRVELISAPERVPLIVVRPVRPTADRFPHAGDVGVCGIDPELFDLATITPPGAGWSAASRWGRALP